ncbi:hypothetical protein AOR13_3749 [Alteromonas stellipolaris LMG 21856]|nr:hypothetical protein AOR13_3749 [Alteromonas stellipolaris LMG 21856]
MPFLSYALLEPTCQACEKMRSGVLLTPYMQRIPLVAPGISFQ